MHNPDLLILDEPTTGVDPLSRRQFWALVDELQKESRGMTVIVATAYIEEAEAFCAFAGDGRTANRWSTRPLKVMRQYGVNTLEEAYIKMLPSEKPARLGRIGNHPVCARPRLAAGDGSARLTKRFGDFTAVDNVSFRIEKGEIFGFLGSNGPRQIHHHENAHPAFCLLRRARPNCWQTHPRRRRMGSAHACGLYVAGVFAV